MLTCYAIVIHTLVALTREWKLLSWGKKFQRYRHLLVPHCPDKRGFPVHEKDAEVFNMLLRLDMSLNTKKIERLKKIIIRNLITSYSCRPVFVMLSD